MGKGQSKSYSISDSASNKSKRRSQLPGEEEAFPIANGLSDKTQEPAGQNGLSDTTEESPGQNRLSDKTEESPGQNGEAAVKDGAEAAVNKGETDSGQTDNSGTVVDEKPEDQTVGKDITGLKELQSEDDKGRGLPVNGESVEETDKSVTEVENREEKEDQTSDKITVTVVDTRETNSEETEKGTEEVKKEVTEDNLPVEDNKEDKSEESEETSTSADLVTASQNIAEQEEDTNEDTGIEEDTKREGEDTEEDTKKEGEDTQPEEDTKLGEEDQEDTRTETMADMVEAVICGIDDLKDGDMREVDVGECKALLVREGQDYFALGAKCTHYGAPLSKGVHCNGRIRCPWHGACFNVKTGDIEDFPGLDSIPKFEVSVADGNVKVKAPKSALANHKRQKVMCESAGEDNSVLIIGGGAAAIACSETLRQEGFQGKITIASMEKNTPYDRPKLSKAMDIDVKSITLRDADFYKKYNINVLTDKEATSVDPEKKTVTFKDGTSETYNSLLIATGGRPRVLPIPGVDLKNVCQLRTPDDANFIAENAKGKNVVIIGSSFIGMEVASFLADKAASLSVVDIIKVPFQLTLGEKVGAVLQKMHEEKGVKFHFESGIKEFVGSDGRVTEAVLSTGVRLPADLCVLGVGVVPATEFLKGSGIGMTDRGFIPVDKEMKTDKPGVYAAGDIVEFPLFSVGDKNVNVQHWQMAHKHGRTAALSIMGKPAEIKSVPYFWTVQYGKSIRYTGYGPGYDDVVVHGDLDALKFVAYFTKGDEVVAVASLNYDPIVSQVAEMMYSGKTITKSEIQNSADGWLSRL